MGRNRKRPKVKKIKPEEVLTSRLMLGLLYFFFYGFVLLVVSNSAGAVFARMAWWFVLGAGLAFIAALVFFIVKRKNHAHEHLKINSSTFLLILAATLVLSLMCIAIFGTGGYWYAVILPAVVCLFSFVFIAYKTWVFTLGVFCLALFGMVFLSEIAFFNQTALLAPRFLFSAFLSLFAAAAVVLIFRLRASDGAIQRKNEARTRIVITGEDARYLPFALAATVFAAALFVRAYLGKFTLYCALAMPLFYIVSLVVFSFRDKNKKGNL